MLSSENEAPFRMESVVLNLVVKCGHFPDSDNAMHFTNIIKTPHSLNGSQVFLLFGKTECEDGPPKGD